MSTTLAVPQASPWESREMIETLKATVCKGASDAQFKMFIEVCKATGLNPFLKEIWYIPNVGVMAGRDGYLRIANEHPQFDGMETRVDRDDKGVPIKATCSVWRKDRNHPITCEAYYSEYKKAGNVWSTYPSAMISKIAEVLALKRSFSINGVVTEEEIGEQKEAAKDAQNTVAQRRIAELKQIPAGSTVSPQEIADIEPEPSYEQRHAAQVMEANAVLDEAQSGREDTHHQPPKRKRGAISFEALKKWGEVKKEILALTGTTDLYYAALRAGGYSHADEIKTPADAATIWKALKEITAECSRSKQDKALMLEVETHALRIGPHAFDYALKARGLQSIEEVLNIKDGTELDAFLGELRELAAQEADRAK